MKINVEIDLDFINEDKTLDDAVKESIIERLSNEIEADFLASAGKSIALAANNLITAKTEQIINTLLERPVTVSNGWKKTTEYNSIFDMVEQKMVALYEGKLNSSGTCKKDPLLENIELYVNSQVKTLLQKVEQSIERNAETAALAAVKNNNLIKALGSVSVDSK